MITPGLIGIISFPVLAVINRYLIKRAQALRDEKYGHHVIIKDVPDIKPEKWFYARVAFAIALLIVFYYLRETDWSFALGFDMLLGIALMQQVFAISYNSTLIQIFRNVIQYPEAISGKIEVSIPHIHHKVLYEFLFLGGMPLLLILLYTPSAFVLGCLIGILGLAFRLWLRSRKSPT